VLDRVEPCDARTVLKLSSAFGGANAALVVSAAPPADAARDARPSRVRDVFVSPAVVASAADADPSVLAQRTAYASDRLARADDLVRLTIAATALLEDSTGGRGSLRGAGIIVGLGLATIETNARFWSRIRSAGASRAEPRRFPYTTPNAAAGECAVAFGLTGPAFAVGGGPHGGIEAISVAADLVRGGIVDRVVVVAADEIGDATRKIAPTATESGAVALLVSSARAPEQNCARGRLVSSTVRLDAVPRTLTAIAGPLVAHLALLPLVRERPEELRVDVPWGGFANARILWL
jgi:3-oxoacyl-[acyl-carrier-protein] synthase-1/3-oxoacyl-[acyl-carrier-protein] synthase II